MAKLCISFRRQRGLDLLTMHLRPSFQIRKLLNSIRLHWFMFGEWKSLMPWHAKISKGKNSFPTKELLLPTANALPGFPAFRMQAFLERFAVKHYGQITCESPWAVDRVREIAPDSDVSLMEYGVEESFI